MRYGVRFTANFDANLRAIRDFLAEQCGDDSGFTALLADPFDNVIPNLTRIPRIGRNFLARKPQSEEGRARLRILNARAGSRMEIREYIAGDYLILYALRRSTAFLLSIRHHRQLSFDLRGHWL